MKKFLRLLILTKFVSCSKEIPAEPMVREPQKNERIQKLLVEGDQFAREGKIELARSHYDSVLVLDPYNPEVIQ